MNMRNAIAFAWRSTEMGARTGKKQIVMRTPYPREYGACLAIDALRLLSTVYVLYKENPTITTSHDNHSCGLYRPVFVTTIAAATPTGNEGNVATKTSTAAANGEAPLHAS